MAQRGRPRMAQSARLRMAHVVYRWQSALRPVWPSSLYGCDQGRWWLAGWQGFGAAWSATRPWSGSSSDFCGATDDDGHNVRLHKNEGCAMGDGGRERVRARMHCCVANHPCSFEEHSLEASTWRAWQHQQTPCDWHTKREAAAWPNNARQDSDQWTKSPKSIKPTGRRSLFTHVSRDPNGDVFESTGIRGLHAKIALKPVLIELHVFIQVVLWKKKGTLLHFGSQTNGLQNAGSVCLLQVEGDASRPVPDYVGVLCPLWLVLSRLFHSSTMLVITALCAVSIWSQMNLSALCVLASS